MSATTLTSAGFSPSAMRLSRPIQSAAWHLTRRGRLIASVASGAVLVLAGLLWIAGSVVSASSAEANPATVAQVIVPPGGSDAATLTPRTNYALIEHTVVPGDTVWGLGQSIARDGDPRASVSRIQKLNTFDSGGLQVGDVVLLPVVE
jgi:hypothetical protein